MSRSDNPNWKETATVLTVRCSVAFNWKEMARHLDNCNTRLYETVRVTETACVAHKSHTHDLEKCHSDTHESPTYTVSHPCNDTNYCFHFPAKTPYLTLMCKLVTILSRVTHDIQECTIKGCCEWAQETSLKCRLITFTFHSKGKGRVSMKHTLCIS